MIRPVHYNDAQAITSIYNYYVINDTATFDEKVFEPSYFESKIKEVTKYYPWIVYELNSEVIGYAYASVWKPRSAYDKTVEVSVYLKPGTVKKGIGSILYKHLLAILKEREFHVLIGGITLPNAASVALHEKFGFKKVAHFEQVGYKFNTWLDVGYWQLTLNK